MTDATADARPFRAVTHKTGIIKILERFGAVPDPGATIDSDTAAQTLWWASQEWASQVLATGVALPQLTAPTWGWLSVLPSRFLGREVGTLLKRDVPRFFDQHPEYLDSHPWVVVSLPGEQTEFAPPLLLSVADLAQGHIKGFDRFPGDVLLQVESPFPCVVEVRCWVAHGEVTAHVPYRLGEVGWDSSLFLEMLSNVEGRELTGIALDVARNLAGSVDGPPGYVVDLGVADDKTAVALRSWPSWAADPLSADPAGVFQSLLAAHDFGNEHPDWTWSPDLRVYERLTIHAQAQNRAHTPDDECPSPIPEEIPSGG